MSAPVQAGDVGPAAVVHVAAEVHQALRTDEGCEQVRGDDVDRQEVRAAEDARVVDHRVDRPQPVDLIGHCPGLVEFGEVSDDG